jgi:AcrR family transcriptional regulator
VIEAAIQAFGMEGFERTSTRALVDLAGTNLVSIHYHFGSKEAVYRAAARHIADAIRERNRPAVERARLTLDRPRATRRALIESVCALFDDFAARALASALPESWRRFLAREQVEPSGTGAFEVILEAIQPSFEAMFCLIARLIDRPPAHPEVRLLAMMIFGQVSVFRTNREAALRLVGWKRFGDRELAEIRAVARKNIFKLLQPRPRTRTARRRPAREAGAV